ncbi:hypothetical protein GDO78_016584 [Eleutherodactylus coqui]|uniref:Taste receptor type 2 n=1 Tax=Eleutherodactylus coqui TaxID=57060 RepID=A0A8J6ECT9_ELECQ|nr:hypothetical protein GDO78_016584 [Eleutherodactylus coqui]
MADSTEGNTDILYLGLLALALIGLTAGLGIHSFIIGVNVTDWWKGRSVTPVDRIVTSLAIARIGIHCADALYIFVAKFFLSSQNSRITLSFISFIYAFFAFANYWLTSLLSIVFCLKISNFHTRLFLYLKGMIVHRTVYFIVAVVLLSAFSCSIPFSLEFTDEIRGVTYNRSIYNLSMGCSLMNQVYSFTIGSFFPLLFYCISAIFLFTSLYHHTTKMKMSSNLSINLETYYSVMKFVSFTFIYNTLHFIGSFACVLYYYLYCVDLTWLYTVLDFTPFLHSSYMIYRTAKLRSQMSKVLQKVIDFLFQRKDKETRENIEIVAL